MNKPKPKKPSTISILKEQILTRKQFWVPGRSKYSQNMVSKIAKETGVCIATDRDTRWKGWDILIKLRSDCHKAPVTIGGNGTTHWHVCIRCKQACGVI